MTPTKKDFVAELSRVFTRAEAQAEASVTVEAGELHRQVGNYPGFDHRMPTCCHTMKACLAVGDEILSLPASGQGQGATLKIRYKLPRNLTS